MTAKDRLAVQGRRCGSAAELRSVILKARRLARDDAERERAPVAVKAWLPDQIQNRRSAAGGPHREKGAEPAVRPRTPRRLVTPTFVTLAVLAFLSSPWLADEPHAETGGEIIHSRAGLDFV